MKSSDVWAILFAAVAVVAILAAAAFRQQAEDWKAAWYRQGALVMDLYGRTCPVETAR